MPIESAIAARLQGVAEPNIAESTRKLLGNLFELQDLGAKNLKGMTGPARTWVALREGLVASRFEALRTSTTPLVGRGEEMALPANRTFGCVSSARHSMKTARSSRSSPISNALPASGATTPPSIGSTSLKLCLHRGATMLARLCRCLPTCSRSRLATATRRST